MNYADAAGAASVGRTAAIGCVVACRGMEPNEYNCMPCASVTSGTKRCSGTPTIPGVPAATGVTNGDGKPSQTVGADTLNQGD